MPALATMLAPIDTSQMTRLERPDRAPSAEMQSAAEQTTQFLRSPLPALGAATPDALRQFISPLIPQKRLVLPALNNPQAAATTSSPGTTIVVQQGAGFSGAQAGAGTVGNLVSIGSSTNRYATGTVNTSGTAVTRASGDYFNSAWVGRPLVINNVVYYVVSVNSITLASLVLTASAGVQTGATFYGGLFPTKQPSGSWFITTKGLDGLGSADVGLGATYALADAIGNVNTSGTAVTWVSGTTFGRTWVGAPINIGSSTYSVASVTDSTHLVLTSTAGTQTSVAYSVTNGQWFWVQGGWIQVAYSATPTCDGALGTTGFELNPGGGVTNITLANLVTNQQYLFVIRFGSGNLVWGAQFIDFPDLSAAAYPSGLGSCVVRARGWWDGSKMYCIGSMGDK